MNSQIYLSPVAVHPMSAPLCNIVCLLFAMEYFGAFNNTYIAVHSTLCSSGVIIIIVIINIIRVERRLF